MENNADKLRELLNIGTKTKQTDTSILKSRHNLENSPPIDDLVRLIQTVENVNQQLLFENKYLKEEISNGKAQILKLIQENTSLHRELKNVTVLEVLTELQNVPTNQNETLLNQLKNKEDELQQGQILINELQKKLTQEINKNTNNSNNRNTKKSITGYLADTLDNIDSYPICCTKCTEEMEIKIRQIENLKNDLEQMEKSKEFLKKKVEEMETKENELLAQVKKHYDLVEHLEMEKNQAVALKDQYKLDKENSDKNLEAFLNEMNEKLLKEKEIIVRNVESQLFSLNEQNKMLEERLFKQDNLVDRLTRDKISVVSELESYKKKCNSIDLDTHQMSEKLKNKYMEALKEKDIVLLDLKRVRHDYDLYVKQNDQEKFCLRNELNSTRNHMIDVEKELIMSKEDCIKFNESINKLESDILLLKNSKNSIENSRNESIKELNDKYEKREADLAQAIESLQSKYCVTVKELEDVVGMQRKLLNKLKEECKLLNEQLELLAIKYKDDTQHMSNQIEEQSIRMSKNEERLKNFEQQDMKHNHLHDRMKDRLKEMTLRLEEMMEKLKKSESNETLMKTTNIQLLHEISTIKKHLSAFTVPNMDKIMSSRDFVSDGKNKKVVLDSISNIGESIGLISSRIDQFGQGNSTRHSDYNNNTDALDFQDNIMQGSTRRSINQTSSVR